MKEQIETRITKLIESVRKAAPKDSSGTPLSDDALERLVDAIEVVLLLVNALEENTPDKIYFKDLQGRFIYVSKSYSTALGDPGEAVGKTDFDIFTAEHAQRLFEDEQQIIRTGEPIVNRVEKEAWLDGSTTWALSTRMPVRDKRGAIAGTFGISRDITKLTHAQEALKKSEERYRILFNHINDVAFVHGITPEGLPGRYTEVNDVASEQTGYTREELLRMSPLDFRPPEGAWREVEQEMMARLKAEKHAAWESIHVSKAGQKIPVEIRSQLLEVGGEPTVLTIMRDLSDLKQLEENLEREKSLLLTLINNLPDYVSVKDTESRVLIANTANARVMGLEAPQEAIGKTDLDFFPREEAARYLADERTVMETGAPLINKEEESIDREGHKRWTLTTKVPLRNSQGRVRGVVCTGRDITERKQAEERIHDLARLSEENPNPVMRVSPDGSILYQNRSSLSLLSSRAWAQGGRIPSEHMPELLKAWATGESRTIEASDNENVVELTIAPVPSRGYINLYGRDITEEKSLAAKFLQAQKMEAVGRLAGGVAHDFNNILQAIIGFSEMILAKSGEKLEVDKYVNIIKGSALRAASLTQHLLAFSRKQMLAPKVVDADLLIEESLEMLTRVLGENISITHESEAKDNHVRVDPGQFGQVITNLAVNARDAMPHGGNLRINVSRREAPGESSVPSFEMLPGEYVLIQVSDTGTGMDQETLSHLFEPFFTTKALGRGTGLGLSIVYGVVRQSGGYIDVESTLGTGTTFSIYLPRVVQIEESPKSCPEQQHNGTETILVVEDEDDVRRLVYQYLSSCGYRVLEAKDGNTARDICRRTGGQIQLLLEDIVLPDMRGDVVAREFSAANPLGRIVFMTGYADATDLPESAKRIGALVLQKPFALSELAARMRQALDQPHADP
ncbi:MAG TPA: PAS domain S-box protein [Spirochaetia bacterium]|nr:PAS domain S-box protein [Spirochaetia bacterium]